MLLFANRSKESKTICGRPSFNRLLSEPTCLIQFASFQEDLRQGCIGFNTLGVEGHRKFQRRFHRLTIFHLRTDLC